MAGQWTQEIPTTAGIYNWRVTPTGPVRMVAIDVVGEELAVTCLNTKEEICINEVLNSSGEWKFVAHLAVQNAAR